MCEKCLESGLSRRGLILGGAAAMAVAATPFLPRQAFAKDAMPVTPDEALKRLIAGNARYVAGTPINTDHSAGRADRAKGQQPFAAIVSCADSRVAPELVFDQGPGDLFVVRVAGNFINEDGLASLEYGAAVLGIQMILVLGHSGCGAVNATIKVVQDGEKLPGHIPSLAEAIRPAVEAAIATHPADLLAAATAENARLNAEWAAKATPILSDLAKAGKLKTASGVYEISTGKVDLA
ncbi:MAG: carbonic anhydrase [Bauldia sp.]|nr:carbonic anhydrase [Bauldia sp.]